MILCLSGDDLEMPMDVWLMGSALKTRRQDYVYINCLLVSETMTEMVVVYFREHDTKWV